MKYLIILGDGMADEPVPSLGGRTPLQAAYKPEMDWLSRHGNNGLLDTIPEGFHPGSEIANLSILGYDLDKVFEGRGSLEAASMGIRIEDGEMAMRCNLITVENGIIRNHSAGQISTEEADILIAFLQEELGGEDFSFFTGVSYRHLLKFTGGCKQIDCTPPHDVVETPFSDHLVRHVSDEGRETARRLNELILRSMEILPSHPVNLERTKEGRPMATSIWPWSPGYRPEMEPLSARFGQIRTGSVISAVDLIKGIGVYAGLVPVEVDGATGLSDTNYEGKAQAALEALEAEDFVFLHIEASDEAGHDGDPHLKVRTIEYLNDRIVRTVLRAVSEWDEEVSIALLPDHPTPCAVRTHTSAPVPFTIYRTGVGQADRVMAFDEFSAAEGSYGLVKAASFMDLFIGRGNSVTN